MAKFCALLFLLLGPLYSVGQNPPSLDLYSENSSFSFAYPDAYDLLDGKSILRRTQGKHAGIPVCDVLTAFACIVYPGDDLDHSKFEAAAFSVNGILGTTEQYCLRFADQLPAHGAHLAIEAVRVNGQLFRYASTTSAIPGHFQSAQRYRSFHKGQCYELRIAISLSAPPASLADGKSVSPNNKDAEKALHSLERVLSSFVFAD